MTEVNNTATETTPTTLYPRNQGAGQMAENIFGKQRGRFDEIRAQRAKRGLTDDFIGAFHAMPLTQRVEAVKLFNDIFGHEHCDDRFELVRR